MTEVRYGIRLDTDRLQADASRAREIFSGIGDSALRESDRIAHSFRNIASVVGVGLGINELRSFGSQVVDTYGRMQLLESSFEVLLQSSSRAKEMIAELTRMSIDSPLELTHFTSAAQTLMGFGIEGEKVTGILSQLSDVSMGNAERFQSLALAYAQTQAAGRLMGQDLLQYINAGFNPLNAIAQQTGKSIATLKEEMSEGAVTADMVAEAFRTVTAEGGQFYQMTQKQAEGMAGIRATFEDTVTQVYRQIGQDNEGLIKSGYELATSLVKNYETIGRALAVLIAGYGSYKAALIAVAAIEKTRAVLQTAKAFDTMTSALRRTTQAQILLNKALGANPYLKLATVLMTAGGLLLTFALRADKAAEAVRELTGPLKDEYEQTNLLVQKLRTANDSESERKRILQELQSVNPSIVRGINDEADAYDKLKDRIREYNRLQTAKIAMTSLSETSGFNAAAEALNKAKGDKLSADADIQGVYARLLANFTRLSDEGLLSGNLTERLQGIFDSTARSTADKVKEIFNIASNPWYSFTTAENSGLDAAAVRSQNALDRKNKQSLTAGLTNKEIRDYNIQLSELKQKTEQYNAAAAVMRERIANIAATVGGEEGEEMRRQLTSMFFPESVLPDPGNGTGSGAENNAKTPAAVLEKLLSSNEDLKMDIDITSLSNAVELEDDLLKKKELEDRLNGLILEKLLRQAKAEREKALASEGLTDEDRKAINAAYDRREELLRQEHEENISHKAAASQKQQQEREKAEKAREYRRQLQAYEEYARRMVEIETWKENELARISDQENKGVITGDKAREQVERVTTTARIDRDVLAADLGLGQDLTAELWASVSGVLEMGVLEIQARMRQLLAELKKTDAAVSPEKAAKLKAEIQALLVQLDNINSTPAESSKDIDKWTDKWEQAGKVIDSVGRSASILQHSFQDVLGEVGNDALSTIQTIAASTVGIINLMTTTAWTGAEAVKTVEKASVILAVISLAIQVIMAIVNVCMKYFSAQARYNAELEESRKRVEALDKEYRNMERTLQHLYGSDYFKKWIDSIDLLKKKQKELDEQMDLARAREQEASTRKNKDKARKDQEEIMQEQQDNAAAILDEQRELFAELLTTDVKGFSQNLAEEMVASFDKGMSGMRDSLEKGLNDMLKSSLTKRLATQFEDLFGPLFDRLFEASKDGTLSDEELQDFMEDFDEKKAAALSLSEQIRQVMEEMGLLDDMQQSGTSKGMESMTAEQGGRLEGLFTSLQIIAIEISRKMDSIALLQIRSNGLMEYLGEGMETYITIASQQLSELVAIRNNTAQITITNKELRLLRELMQNRL